MRCVMTWMLSLLRKRFGLDPTHKYIVLHEGNQKPGIRECLFYVRLLISFHIIDVTSF